MMTMIVNTVKTMFGGKVRLVIEYLLIGSIVFLCGTSYSLWIKSEKLEEVIVTNSENIVKLKDANDHNQRMIQWLLVVKAADREAITSLAKSITGIQKGNEKFEIAVRTLERNNVTVSQYLNSPIPHELRRVYATETANYNGQQSPPN